MEMEESRRGKSSYKNSNVRGLVSWTTIGVKMKDWAVLYNDKKLEDNEHLKKVAKAYAGILKERLWTNRRFEAAADHAVQSCKFYPKVADLVEADKELGNRNQYNEKNENDPPTEMSEVHRIFFSLPGKLKNNKNPATDYPEYGPTLEELKSLSPEECRSNFHKQFPQYKGLV